MGRDTAAVATTGGPAMGIDLLALARAGADARLVAADAWEERGRLDVADLLARRVQPRDGTRARVDKLTEPERARMAPWAARWIEIGLSTSPADRPLFEAAVDVCYEAAGLAPPRRVVWCPSPIVAALAGPIASSLLGGGAVNRVVGAEVHGAVRGVVGVEVSRAVVHDAADDAVSVEVSRAVNRVVGAEVHGAVDDAVCGAVDDEANHSLFTRPGSEWWRYLGGQFWVGGLWWGPAYVSFLLDVLRVEIAPDLELRARAYAATCQSACWWWPHREFVLVSERPHTIERRPDGSLVRAAWEGWEVTP